MTKKKEKKREKNLKEEGLCTATPNRARKPENGRQKKYLVLCKLLPNNRFLKLDLSKLSRLELKKSSLECVFLN